MAEICITALLSFSAPSLFPAVTKPGSLRKRLLAPTTGQICSRPASALIPSPAGQAFEVFWIRRSQRVHFYVTALPAARGAHTGNQAALMIAAAPAEKSLALLVAPAVLTLGGRQRAAGMTTPHRGLAERWQRTPLRIMAANTAVTTPTHRRGVPWVPQLVLPALPAAISQVLSGSVLPP